MDNLANLFSAIQNGQQRQKKFIRVPFSKKSWHLCNILFLEGFLQGFFAQENHLYIFLKYSQNKPVLRKISKISLQGRKIYTKAMGLKFIERPTEKGNSELVALKEFPRTSLMSSGFDGPMSLESIVLGLPKGQYQTESTQYETWPTHSQLSFRETRKKSFCVKILSTSKGILSDRDARFFGIGGELLCEIF